jgi:hypothetical protein
VVVIKLEARGTSWIIFNSRRTTRQIKAAAKIKKVHLDTVLGARLCPAMRDQPQPLRKTSLLESV